MHCYRNCCNKFDKNKVAIPPELDEGKDLENMGDDDNLGFGYAYHEPMDYNACQNEDDLQGTRESFGAQIGRITGAEGIPIEYAHGDKRSN